MFTRTFIVFFIVNRELKNRTNGKTCLLFYLSLNLDGCPRYALLKCLLSHEFSVRKTLFLKDTHILIQTTALH